VGIEIGARAFSSWDAVAHRWARPSASFELLVGRSSRDIVARVPVTVSGEVGRSSTLTDMSPLRDWLEDETVRQLASGALRDIAPILGATFGE
jgi:hypothetical protein